MPGQLLQNDDRDTREPIQIIIDAVIKYQVKVLVVLFSGGKDSLVTVKITELAIARLREMGIVVEMELLHCYTGTGSHENFEYVLYMAEKNNWQLNIEWPQNNQEYPQIPFMNLIREIGFPGKNLHSMTMRILKIESMERFMQKRLGNDVTIDSLEWQERVLKGGIWLVSGRGAKNSPRRTRKHDQEMKEGAFDDITARVEWNLPFVKPLIRTAKTFVWQIIRQFSLELIDSYNYVHHSLECNCGAQAKKGELKEIKRWYKKIAIDMEILSEQFGGKHKVTDEYGRTYIRDFGTWGTPPESSTAS